MDSIQNDKADAMLKYIWLSRDRLEERDGLLEPGKHIKYVL